MPKMKGATLISEFLVKEKIPYVFGIRGHGNIGLLDGLYEVRDKIKLVSPRHEQVAGHMADGYSPRQASAGRHPDLDRPRLSQSDHVDGSRADGFLRAARDHGKRADFAVQSRPVPGTQPAQPGGFPERDPPGGEA